MIKNESMRFQLHHLVCHIFVWLFDDFNTIASLRLQRSSLAALRLSEYLQIPNLNEKHKQSIIDAARLFLNKLNNVGPSEILSDNAMLLDLMREEYVAHQVRTHTLEDRLNKLEAS